MSKEISDKYGNVTLIDVKLASVYYQILMGLAKHKHCLTYGELIAKAKEQHPDIPEVQNAVPVGTGRRLEVVRYFTEQHGYPDLTSLVISKSTGECGEWVLERYDPVKLREEVFTFDWSKATLDFDGFLQHTAKQIIDKAKPKPKKSDAEKLMYEYYKQHKSVLPSSITKKRELIVKLLMDGLAEEVAFSQAVAQL